MRIASATASLLLFAAGVDGPYAAGVLTYSVRHPLWTDGAEKQRHLRLPPGGTIDTSEPDHWAFPEGTRVYKEFLVDGVPVETRLLWKTGPTVDDWVYVSYRYRPDGSDADPVPDGEADVRGTTHDVPDQAGCFDCHRGGGDFVLGIGALQLDRVTFDRWVGEGVLPPEAPWEEPPGDETERAALGYLHGNCGHCHGEVHPLARMRQMRLRLPVGLADADAAPARTTTVGQGAQHLIEGTDTLVVAGEPDRSQVYVRMGLRDILQMPTRGTEEVDDAGRAAVAAWILAGP